MEHRRVEGMRIALYIYVSIYCICVCVFVRVWWVCFLNFLFPHRSDRTDRCPRKAVTCPSSNNNIAATFEFETRKQQHNNHIQFLVTCFNIIYSMPSLKWVFFYGHNKRHSFTHNCMMRATIYNMHSDFFAKEYKYYEACI